MLAVIAVFLLTAEIARRWELDLLEVHLLNIDYLRLGHFSRETSMWR